MSKLTDYRPDMDPPWVWDVPCPDCDGEGEEEALVHPDNLVSAITVCKTCGGRGEVDSRKLKRI